MRTFAVFIAVSLSLSLWAPRSSAGKRRRGIEVVLRSPGKPLRFLKTRPAPGTGYEQGSRFAHLRVAPSKAGADIRVEAVDRPGIILRSSCATGCGVSAVVSRGSASIGSVLSNKARKGHGELSILDVGTSDGEVSMGFEYAGWHVRFADDGTSAAAQFRRIPLREGEQLVGLDGAPLIEGAKQTLYEAVTTDTHTLDVAEGDQGIVFAVPGPRPRPQLELRLRSFTADEL